MILECPSCHAKFSVPDGALGTAGKQVRCSKCAHTWLAKPPAAETLQPIPSVAPVANIPQEPVKPKAAEAVPSSTVAEGIEDVPAKKQKKSDQKKAEKKPPRMTTGDALEREEIVIKTPSTKRPISRLKIAAYVLAYALLFAITGSLWVLKEHPEWVGFHGSQGFSFEQMKVERMPQLGGERFTSVPMYTLEGVIRNTSDAPRQRPIIRVTLKKNNGREVYMQEHPSPNTIISAGEATAFSIEKLPQPNPEDQYFVVEMGNPLEFLLRKVPVTAEVKSAKH
jgi:predicted Zn finger-like uncharacterized protein